MSHIFFKVTASKQGSPWDYGTASTIEEARRDAASAIKSAGADSVFITQVIERNVEVMRPKRVACDG